MTVADRVHDARQLPAPGPPLVLKERVLVPLVVFALSRAILLAIAASAGHLLVGPSIRANASVLPSSDALARLGSWARPWFRFDAAWYVGVVQHGYHWGSGGTANVNFLPLYPVLARAIQPLAGGSPWLAAWLAANAAFLAALILLWNWALRRWDRQIALRVILLVTVFPFSFFFMTPYAEPLFLAVTVATFLLVETDHWAWAAAAAGAAAITRPVGPAVILALVIMAVYRRSPRLIALSLLSVLPLAAFYLYLGATVGHPLAFTVNHSAGWVPPRGGIWQTFTSQFHTRLSPFDRVDAACAIVFLASVPLVWRRLGPGYGAYTAAGVLLPLAHGLVSMERYVIVLFPAMAAWATIEKKPLQAGLFAISTLGLFLATSMFAVGFTLV